MSRNIESEDREEPERRLRGKLSMFSEAVVRDESLLFSEGFLRRIGTVWDRGSKRQRIS